MIKSMLNEIQNYLKMCKIEKNIDIQNTYVLTIDEFYNREKVFLTEDFVAGYTFYHDTNYIILSKKLPGEPRIRSVLFHECMHLFSNKKIHSKNYIGITFPKEKFTNLNEGANEIISGYLFSKIYNGNYVYCKSYKINRIICQHIIDAIYDNKMDFIESYLTENPYEFYKKVFYYFKVNNLLEMSKILKKIYNAIGSNKNMDIYEIYDIIDLYLIRR